MTQLVTTSLSGDQIGEYLNALRTCHGMERAAARMAGIKIADIRRLRKQSQEFAEQESEIFGEASEAIEREMYRRGVEGIPRERFYKGEYTHTETEYSDTLLLALAKGNMPDKYGDKKQISGSIGGAVEVVIRNFDSVSSAPPARIIDVNEPPPANGLTVPAVTKGDTRGQIPTVVIRDPDKTPLPVSEITSPASDGLTPDLLTDDELIRSLDWEVPL